MHLVFFILFSPLFITCSEITLCISLKNIVFKYCLNDPAYKKLNKKNFYHYISSTSGRPYRIAFPSLGMVNHDYYNTFLYSLTMFNAQYLEKNFLSLLPVKECRLLNPYLPKKLTCFFKGIDYNTKDNSVKLSRTYLAFSCIQKHIKWTNHLKDCTTILNTQFLKPYQKLSFNALENAKKDLKNSIITIARSIQIKTDKLEKTLYQDFLCEYKTLKENIYRETIFLEENIKLYKNILFALKDFAGVKKIAPCLTKKYNDDITLTSLNEIVEKKLKKNNDLLLNFFSFVIFPSIANTTQHKNLISNNHMDQYYRTIHNIIKNSIDTYGSYFVVKNKPTNYLSYQKIISRRKAEDILKKINFTFLYWPIKNNILNIDLSNNDLFEYYRKILANQTCLYLFNDINSIEWTIPYENIIFMWDLFENIPKNISFQFTFIDNNLNADRNKTIIINEDLNYLPDNFNKIFKQYHDAYVSFIKTVRRIIVRSNAVYFFTKPDWITFFRNLPENIEVLFDSSSCFRYGIFTLESRESIDFLQGLNKLLSFEDKISDLVFKNVQDIHFNDQHDLLQSNKQWKKDFFSFCTAFLKIKAKKNRTLFINNSLLSLIKFKDKPKYKSIFDGINTIQIKIQTKKECDDYIEKLFYLPVDYVNNLQVKVIVPAQDLKKYFASRFLHRFLHRYLYKVTCYILVILQIYNTISVDKNFIFTIIVYLMLVDYNYINPSSPIFNLIRFGLNSIKNKSFLPVNTTIEIEQ